MEVYAVSPDEDRRGELRATQALYVNLPGKNAFKWSQVGHGWAHLSGSRIRVPERAGRQ